jgi:site-specific recombinase XerD
MSGDLAVVQPGPLALAAPQPADQNPALVYLAGLGSDRGRIVQGQALQQIAELLTGSPDLLACNWAAVRFQHSQAVRARLLELKSRSTGQSLAPATINRQLCALRGTLKAAWQLGQISAEDYQRAADIPSVRGSTLPAGRELAGGELQALLGACENDTSSAGVRDAAIIALAYSCGLRRAELAGLDLGDYDPEAGRLTIRGKGRKERTVYPVEGAARALADWLAIRGSSPGPIFWPVNKGGKLQPRRMTTQAIYNLLEKRGAEAKVAAFSPHDLRRTFVSDLLDAGADISTVAGLAGHASVNTTARYDRRPEQAKQKANQRLHVPYRGRLVR